jgi:hypothetical protein
MKRLLSLTAVVITVLVLFLIILLVTLLSRTETVVKGNEDEEANRERHHGADICTSKSCIKAGQLLQLYPHLLFSIL